jgi:hypothetical protein
VRAIALLLPSALNLGIAQILAPVLNALLARTADPQAAIGGFAVALGITGLVALPQLRIQHLTLVYFEDRASLVALRRFVAVFIAIVSAVALLVALTPLSGVVLERLFATDGAVRNEAARALIALIPFPALAVARMHLYGIALRTERPGVVWGGTIGGAAAVLTTASVLLATGVEGALVAGIAVSTGAALEVVALALVTGVAGVPGGHRIASVVPAETPSQRALIGFFTPLLFAAFIPAVSAPLIMATVARSPEPAASLAAFPLAVSLFTFVTLVSNGVQPTVLSLFGRGDDPRGIRRFAILVGFVGMAGSLLIAWVPPLTSLLVEDLIGAEGRLRDLTVVGLRVLSFLPPLLTVEQLFAAALLHTKRTRALVYVNAWRLLGLIVFLLVVRTSTDWSGAAIGAGAVAFTLTLEAVAAFAYGRKPFASLLPFARERV